MNDANQTSRPENGPCLAKQTQYVNSPRHPWNSTPGNLKPYGRHPNRISRSLAFTSFVVCSCFLYYGFNVYLVPTCFCYDRCQACRPSGVLAPPGGRSTRRGKDSEQTRAAHVAMMLSRSGGLTRGKPPWDATRPV